MSDDELYARMVVVARKLGASTLQDVFTMFHLDDENHESARDFMRRHWEGPR